jgi:hypothetical protein
LLVDDVTPALMSEQPIRGGEVAAGWPFGGRNARLGDWRDFDVGVHGLRSPQGASAA